MAEIFDFINIKKQKEKKQFQDIKRQVILLRNSGKLDKALSIIESKYKPDSLKYKALIGLLYFGPKD